MGVRFHVVKPKTKEVPQKGETPRSLVKRLALEKAQAVKSRTRKPSTILSADTVVVAPNGKEILGKPRDRKHAGQILQKLSGKTHTVVTGYCLFGFDSKGREKKLLRAIQTRVTFRKLSRLDIQNYLKKNESWDKAGAYAAQGYGMLLIQKVNGSYANVVGLPVLAVSETLKREFGIDWLQ